MGHHLVCQLQHALLQLSRPPPEGLGRPVARLNGAAGQITAQWVLDIMTPYAKVRSAQGTSSHMGAPEQVLWLLKP